MARYLNQIAYTIEDGEGATWQVVSDRKLSVEEIVYHKLKGDYTEDELEGEVMVFIDNCNPSGPDHLDLEALVVADDELPKSPDYLERWKGD